MLTTDNARSFSTLIIILAIRVNNQSEIWGESDEILYKLNFGVYHNKITL